MDLNIFVFLEWEEWFFLVTAANTAGWIAMTLYDNFIWTTALIINNITNLSDILQIIFIKQNTPNICWLPDCCFKGNKRGMMIKLHQWYKKVQTSNLLTGYSILPHPFPPSFMITNTLEDVCLSMLKRYHTMISWLSVAYNSAGFIVWQECFSEAGTKLIFLWLVCLKNAILVSECSKIYAVSEKLVPFSLW